MKCLSCNQEMVLQKKFDTKPRGKKKTKYRIQRFYCSLCDISQTQFGDGAVEELKVKNAVAAAKLDLEGYKCDKKHSTK